MLQFCYNSNNSSIKFSQHNQVNSLEQTRTNNNHLHYTYILLLVKSKIMHTNATSQILFLDVNDPERLLTFIELVQHN